MFGMVRIFLIATLLIHASSIAAQELSGRWKGSFKRGGGEHGIPQLFILKQDGAKVTGSGGPDDSEQYPISKGTVTGNVIRFELTTARSKFFYDLTLAGAAELKGNLEIKSIDRVDKAIVMLSKEK